MQVNVLYDEYTNKINKATLLFENDKEMELEIIKEVEIVDEGEEKLTDKIKITSTDIENEINKEDLRTLMNLIRNLLNQL